MFSFYNNTYFCSYETLVLEFRLLHPNVFSGKKKKNCIYFPCKIRKKPRPPRALFCGQKAVSVLQSRGARIVCAPVCWALRTALVHSVGKGRTSSSWHQEKNACEAAAWGEQGCVASLQSTHRWTAKRWHFWLSFPELFYMIIEMV